MDDETNILMTDEAGTRKDQFWTTDHKAYNTILILRNKVNHCHWSFILC